MNTVSAEDLKLRKKKFHDNMKRENPDWEVALIFSKINIFYFTGTTQNGVIIIPRNGELMFFVKRSFERSMIESHLENIYPMTSYKDILEYFSPGNKTVYIEKEVVPYAYFERFNKYFKYETIKPLDNVLSKTRSVKTDYELSMMTKAGEIHDEVMTKIAPNLLKEGVSELEVGTELFKHMIYSGHQGICRMRNFNAEMFLGAICFGDNANFYHSHDGPVGMKGISPAVPLLGSRDRKLKKNDLIIIDTVCGYGGYYTDKTLVYYYGTPPQPLKDTHARCISIQNEIVDMLKPGNIPSEIYQKITDAIEDSFDENFMGYGSNKVKFLGHGIGLVVDEYPVIAPGFDEPLQMGMTLAIEPKKSITNIGMVGIENTFLVGENGGISLTGINHEIIEI